MLEKDNKNPICFFVLLLALSYFCGVVSVLPILHHLNIYEFGWGDLVGYNNLILWLSFVWLVDYGSSFFIKTQKRRVIITSLFVLIFSYCFGFLNVYYASHSDTSNKIILKNGSEFDSKLMIFGKKFSYIIQEKGGIIVNSKEIDRIIPGNKKQF